jgi:predicted acetylornithine/succinylornithine family transaminase
MENEIVNKENENILQTYKRLPIIIDHAEGAYIFDINGNAYLDFLSGIAVNILGYSHKKIIDSLESQIKRYMHVSNYFYQDAQINFADKLIKISGYDKVFLSNSGAEAIEGAIKIIRRWGNRNGKKEIIAFSGGFHGRTYGALSLMDKPHYKDMMGPFLDNMKVIEFNDIDALKENVSDNTAALLFEFIQGEGGIKQAAKEWVNEIFRLRDVYGFKVIADEIQAGSGRSGRFFSFEHYNVRPDVVTLAKGIGGGLPLGCFLVDEQLIGVFEPGMHGTTFGGNALACAAGNVVIDELLNGVMDNAAYLGEFLEQKLFEVKSEFPDKVLEIRGKGLMRGILLSFNAAELVAQLLKRKVITNSASGYVLRILPPLNINKSEVEIFIDELKYCLAHS